MLLSYSKQGQSLGPRPEVLFIHGTGAAASLWQPHVELLVSEGFGCYTLELRGHGLSVEPGEHTDLAVHVQDVLDTVTQANLRVPAILVGHSLGAMISLELAKQQPEKFLGILAVSLPGRVPRITSAAFAWFLTWPYQLIKDSFIHRRLPRREQVLVATELHSLQQIVRNFADVNYLDHPPDLGCEIHLCVGRLDVVAPAHYLKRLHCMMPNSTLRIFDWAGHSCMDDQPQEFNDWLVEKVTALAQASSLPCKLAGT